MHRLGERRPGRGLNDGVRQVAQRRQLKGHWRPTRLVLESSTGCSRRTAGPKPPCFIADALLVSAITHAAARMPACLLLLITDIFDRHAAAVCTHVRERY